MNVQFRAMPRYQALSTAQQRTIPKFKKFNKESSSNAELFGCDTFNYAQMAKMLPAADVQVLKEYSLTGDPISPEIAGRVALAVKQWAVEKGATHYTHWFQPQTESTAEKHDSFLDFNEDGIPIDKFNSSLLICQEPDASSFPSGGRRTTFEARGYTLWDASSFMFLYESKNGKTLTIPSLFISYFGESLDNKTPLLRSIRALNTHATEALNLLDEPSSHVVVNCGPEQEFFVIDSALYGLRPDLQLAGKTVLGSASTRGQQLDDHYFGTINHRVISMMMEVEDELIRLGVPIKTRHNEVAPSQYEMAPIYEPANLAADHNRLVMATLKKVSRKHNLSVLFHEKPFEGLNGSGKHLNWSVATADGVNLLSPGQNPQNNLRFLYFLTATLKGVFDHGDLLRASVAVPGNDFRMGANEAPPAIMSIFLGDTLSQVVTKLISGSTTELGEFENELIDLNLPKIPVVNKDNTDRNRTSPFAFTGNKFEFRALGGSQSISTPITYLNTAVADALASMNQEVSQLQAGGATAQKAIFSVIVQNLAYAKHIHFDGDSYSDEWTMEAEKRGLPHLKTTPEALEVLTQDKTTQLLKNHGVMSHTEEITARYNVFMERYVMLRLIELETAHEMLLTHVYPAATQYTYQLAKSLAKSQKLIDNSTTLQGQQSHHQRCATLTAQLISECDALAEVINHTKELGQDKEAGHYIANQGLTALGSARKIADELETLIDDTLWSLPRYREILFVN